jgi:hypothetical protein
MSELSNGGLSHKGRRARITSGTRDRAARVPSRTGLALTRFRAEERAEIAELLQLLAAKPGDAENGVS